jgi:hypothetical protein
VTRPDRGETIKLSLAAGVLWALALLGMYAQPQLLEPIMADRGALEGAVGQMFSFENGSFFITLLKSTKMTTTSAIRSSAVANLSAVSPLEIPTPGQRPCSKPRLTRLTARSRNWPDTTHKAAPHVS